MWGAETGHDLLFLLVASYCFTASGVPDDLVLRHLMPSSRRRGLTRCPTPPHTIVGRIARHLSCARVAPAVEHGV